MTLFRLAMLQVLILFSLFCSSCKRTGASATGFYYWKSTFQLNKQQRSLINSNTPLYIRMFDIQWDAKTAKPYPEAKATFKQSSLNSHFIPVVFITNKTFEKLNKDSVASLALKTNILLQQLTKANGWGYKKIQIDCDWTLTTKEAYFSFLKSLKSISKKQTEATIRLHQVKYRLKTGVPPVDRGVLMFYNMGKLSPNVKEPNSIYNPVAAEKYLSTLHTYPLHLDIALPVFSWSLHIRDDKIVQVYAEIGAKELSNTANFAQTDIPNVYKATRSFFKEGFYIKENDLFKFEESNKQTLMQAADQVAAHLSKDSKRTIIYYELSNLNFSSFKAQDFKEISAHF